MAAEAVPQSVNWDDNLRITWTAEAEDPKSAADLLAGVDLTYSLKSLTRTINEARIEDPRLTLKQILERPGKVTEQVEVQYVFGDDGDVAAATLVQGTKGHLTLRYSIPNSTAWTAAQIVDVITVECGKQRKDSPVENGVQTITQTLFVVDATDDDVAVTV
jgi:hypothetical protein